MGNIGIVQQSFGGNAANVQTHPTKPLFINESAEGVRQITETIFFDKSVSLFAGDFGRDENGLEQRLDVRIGG